MISLSLSPAELRKLPKEKLLAIAVAKEKGFLGSKPSNEKPLPGSKTPWRDWLRHEYSSVVFRPLGDRHVRLWEWFDALEPGVRPRPRVEIWPRMGGKSTTTELGCVRACVKLSRRYALCVSETQEQADKHVSAIASFLERIGVQRAVNVYGSSRGWRRQELRTANGFNVSAIGLDAAIRGAKLDEYRPDLIIIDDIDHQDDTEEIRKRKINALTTAIIPAGSDDCAYLFLQNRIHEDSIFSQLADGRADFLHDRDQAFQQPAVIDLETERFPRGDGMMQYRIIGGTATWEGQDIAVCERQINDWGLTAFQREAQHNVKGAGGIFFDTDQIQWCDASEVPNGLRLCRPWDLAGTEGGGDWTAGPLMGMRGEYPQCEVWIIPENWEQWGTQTVRSEILAAAKRDGPTVDIRIPQDPAQGGKYQTDQLREDLKGYPIHIENPTGAKWVRARGLQACMNLGNVHVVRTPHTEHFQRVFRKFKEEVNNQEDDMIDACATGFNWLAKFGDTPPLPKRNLIEDQSWLPRALQSKTVETTDDPMQYPSNAPAMEVYW